MRTTRTGRARRSRQTSIDPRVAHIRKHQRGIALTLLRLIDSITGR